MLLIEWMNMQFYLDTFGEELATNDKHAALKFSLNQLFTSHDLDYLEEFLSMSDKSAEIGGDPGWDIACRSVSDSNPVYASWPLTAVFRVHVDPAEFFLNHPEGFYTKEEFVDYIRAFLEVYIQKNPDRISEFNRLKRYVLE